MLTELKFVQGAVAKKDFVPALTHFAIENGTVRGYNGMLALCSPIGCDIKCNPKSEPMVKAIAGCTETVQLALTTAGRLSISSGRFKAFIDCVEGDTPHVMPEGEDVEIDGAAMLAAMETLVPFIGDDASRPWTNGMLLQGSSAYATNNIMVVEYWTGANVPHPINVPRAAVKEMIRIGEAPTRCQLTDSSISFHFSGDRWLRTQLFSTEWPDVNKMLDVPSNPVPIDPMLFEALKTVKPFVDKTGRILFKGDGNIATHETEGEGASCMVDGFTHPGIYHNEILALLQGRVERIDWSTYPKPCMFFGTRIRGAMVGMHQ